MIINLRINLEAKDKVLEVIKIIEKGVMANNVWKPSRYILENNYEDDIIKKTDELPVDDFKNIQKVKKNVLEKISNDKNYKNILVENNFRKIFEENIAKNSLIHLEKSSNISEVNFNNKSKNILKSFFKNIYNYKKNNKKNEKNITNNLSTVDSSYFSNKLSNQNTFKNFENRFLKESNSTQSIYKILMEKTNYEHLFGSKTSNSNKNNFVINNSNKNYKKMSEKTESVTNNFYENIVINCTSEEVKKEVLLETLNNHTKNIISLIENKGGINYYG